MINVWIFYTQVRTISIWLFSAFLGIQFWSSFQKSIFVMRINCSRKLKMSSLTCSIWFWMTAIHIICVLSVGGNISKQTFTKESHEHQGRKELKIEIQNREEILNGWGALLYTVSKTHYYVVRVNVKGCNFPHMR